MIDFVCVMRYSCRGDNYRRQIPPCSCCTRLKHANLRVAGWAFFLQSCAFRVSECSFTTLTLMVEKYN